MRHRTRLLRPGAGVIDLRRGGAGGARRAGRRSSRPGQAAAVGRLALDRRQLRPRDLGRLARPGVLRWQASAFVSPFEFPVDRVNAIHWPPPAASAKPDGDFCFELAGGDVVFGALVALDDKQAELDIPRIGRLQVRSLDRSIESIAGAAAPTSSIWGRTA